MSFIELCFRYPLTNQDILFFGEDYFKVPLEIASEMGFDVKVYSLRTHEHRKQTENLEGIAVQRFDNSFELMKNLLKESPTLIHGHTFGWIPSTFTPLFKRPYIMTPHTDMAKPRNLHAKNALYAYARYMLSLWSLSYADKFLVQTHYTKKSFSRFIKEEKIEVLPLPINYKCWIKSNQKGEHTIRTKDTKKLIVTIAGIHGMQQRKNTKTLLYALKLVNQSMSGIKVAIVGSDPQGYNQNLKNYVSGLGLHDEVIFLGPLSRDRLVQAFNESDVFALPTLWECQCMAAYEAAAAGLPLVLSNLPVLTEVFRECALFHKPLDYVTLARQLKRILTDQALVDTFTKRAKEKMKAYDVSFFIPRLKKIYEHTFERC